MEGAIDSTTVPRAYKDEHMLLLNDNAVLKIFGAQTIRIKNCFECDHGFFKEPEKKVRSQEKNYKLSWETKKVLMGSYSEQKTLVGKIVKKPVETFLRSLLG